jgi:hypothetical protein
MNESPSYRYPRRRGMLLLLVMLMLSLFMAIGAWLLTITLRSRASARAFGSASIASSMNEELARETLDEALLSALRGSPAAFNGSVAITSGSTWENILEDKYGKPVFATGSIQLGTTPSAFMSLSLNTFLESGTVPGQLVPSPSGTTPSRLNGRVLTIKPLGNDGEIVSYRILGASGTSPAMTVHVATLPDNRLRRQPTGAFDVVINGREFTPVSGTNVPEAYDAYDDANLWLAQPVITGTTNPAISAGQVDYFNRGSYLGEFVDDSPGGLNKDLEFIRDNFPQELVDNDNDGVPDGIWLPPSSEVWGVANSLNNAIALGAPTPAPRVIPDRPSPLGGTIRTQVSYLILDLDGRVNINAAGVSAPSGNIYGSTPANVPFGMGYGPADLDPSFLFPATLDTGTSGFVITSTGTWQPLLKSGTPAVSGTLQPTVNQRRVQPLLGLIEGRYGQNGFAGIDGDDSSPFQLTGTTTGTTASGTASSYWSLVTTGSISTNLADLQGRRKVYMTQPAAGEITPTLTFFTGTASAATARAAAASDAADDPYELRLDADAPRPSEYRRLTGTDGSSVNPYTVDNPFTPPELERILRANDPDALQLPQRLAAGAAQHAQQARMTITTDSWDTPALTGAAARVIEDYLATTGTSLDYTGTSSWRTTGSGSSNAVSPDIAAGLRFNINRPVLSGTSDEALRQQHEYCKGLYTLALMLGETNTARAAQWAVNALDFRDEDDRISWFEYDTNINNGWNVDGLLSTTSEPNRAVVWGAERPDVVITETAAFENTVTSVAQLFVTLRRMSHVTFATGTSGTTTVSGTSAMALSSPVWQLRFPNNNVVQFLPSAAPTPPDSSQFISGVGAAVPTTFLKTGTSSTPFLQANSGSNAYICVCPPLPHPTYTATLIPNYIVDQGGTLRLPTGAATGVVTLERLANPLLSHSAMNPYVVVDSATVTNVFIPAASPQSRRRRGPSDPVVGHRHAVFWATGTSPWMNGGTSLGLYPSPTPTAPAPWFHWPNRPFISQAELALVPTGTTSPYQIFADGNFPTSSLVISGSNTFTFGTQTVSGSTVPASGTASLGNLLLEATYVPSRFAGNSITVSGSTVERFGLDIFQANQLSKWREPGKLNINTIVSGTSSGIDVDDVIWSILMSGTYPGNSFAGTPRRRTTPAIPGGGGVPATPAVPGQKGTPAAPARGIGHLLSLTSPTPPPPHYPIFTGTLTMLTGGSNGHRDTNPFFTYSQAIRLANTATIRSQVFAVWITVRITDDSPNAPSPVTKRMFAIIDRSIPVGYAPGQDLNVRDTIRLKRFLD